MKEYINTGNKDTRSGFGAGLLEVAEKNENVVGLCADLTGSLKMESFKSKFPDRFFQAGIAEANMIGVAAGLATGGKIPFAGTFAVFATGRAYDQVRQSIAYSNKNVKICASHAGLTLGEDGATHQILEDIGLMKMLPNMTVICTCDYNQTKAATIAIADYEGPVYLRFGRPPMPNFTDPNEKFIIGKAQKMIDGSDVSVFATGHMVWKALEAAKVLQQKGISAEIINIHTIKPLDVSGVLSSLEKTNAAVTAEEHMLNGGLTDSITQLTALNKPVPIEAVAVFDTFGESGTPEDLLEKYGLNVENIVKAAEKAINRKNNS